MSRITSRVVMKALAVLLGLTALVMTVLSTYGVGDPARVNAVTGGMLILAVVLWLCS